MKITLWSEPDSTFCSLYQRMFRGMAPLSDHRYFLPRHGLAFSASWRAPKKTIRARLGDFVRDILFGGPGSGSPEGTVDPEAYQAALDLVDRQELAAAAAAFTELGYEVSIHPLR